MDRIVKANEIILNPKEYNGQRVVTFKDVDAVHGRAEGTAGRNFRDNKERFIEGVDYFRRNPSEAKKEFGAIAPNGLFLLTETGYLMLVKSFTDELAWAVQRELVNNYFRKKEAPILASCDMIDDAELGQLKIAAKDFALYYFDKLNLKGQGQVLHFLHGLTKKEEYTKQKQLLVR